MKTLKNVEGNFLRATDARAEKLVKTGQWKYCPKSEWKENVRDNSNK